MDYLYYAGQGLGIVAFIIGTTVFVQRNERKLKIRLSIYTAIMASHFFLLGAYPAAICFTDTGSGCAEYPHLAGSAAGNGHPDEHLCVFPADGIAYAVCDLVFNSLLGGV